MIGLSAVSESQEDLVCEMAAGSESMPAVKHYEQKEFSGMFEYSKGDELIVVRKLILGWRPRVTTASYVTTGVDIKIH